MQNAKSVRPLAGFVLLEQIKEKETSSGLRLTESGQDFPMGKVVAASESFINDHGIQFICPVLVGDTVAYRKYTNEKIVVDFVEYESVRFSDLVAVIEPSKPKKK